MPLERRVKPEELMPEKLRLSTSRVTLDDLAEIVRELGAHQTVARVEIRAGDRVSEQVSDLREASPSELRNVRLIPHSAGVSDHTYAIADISLRTGWSWAFVISARPVVQIAASAIRPYRTPWFLVPEVGLAAAVLVSLVPSIIALLTDVDLGWWGLSVLPIILWVNLLYIFRATRVRVLPLSRHEVREHGLRLWQGIATSLVSGALGAVLGFLLGRIQ